jgi:hypothetical protein
MVIKNKQQLLISIILFLLVSCIVEYIPDAKEEQEMLVVEGIITDQPGINIIRIAKSIPLWKTHVAKPLQGCTVWISDDLGQIYSLKETNNGEYNTDPATFQGVTGRKYSLHIRRNGSSGILNYESSPVEMKSVPPVDSIYYEKKTYQYGHKTVEGCEIYLDTHDPANKCNFYKWSYSETWEFHLPFNVANKVCWTTENSDGIFIKNTSILTEDRVLRYPINSIPDPVDKLSVKYSILVSQYSLNEDEYLYWDRLKNSLDQVGDLYDLIPAFIPNNIYCVEDPDEKILGYFSVSAVTSKRIFIKDNFAGFDDQYEDCITDTIYGNIIVDTLRGLNSFIWLIIDNSYKVPPERIFTRKRGCADCLVRGTNIEPVFWKEGK